MMLYININFSPFTISQIKSRGVSHMNNRNIVFKGTLQECIVEYNNNNHLDDLHNLAKYIDIPYDTIYSWLTKDTKLIDINKLKCIYFMEKQGYICYELESMLPQIYVLGKLIANNVLSFDTAMKDLGYKSRDSFFDILNGTKSIKKNEMRKWDDYLRNYTTEHMFLQSSEYKNEEKFIPHLYDQKIDPLRHNAALKIFKHQILSMLPITEYLLSDKFSDGERDKLRQAIPNDGLITLANALHALCSKEMKEIILSNGLFDKKRD